MTNDRLGKTIIDELRLCFTAESKFLKTISCLDFGERIDFDRISLIRIVGQHFEYYYTLLDKNNHIVAYMYHGRYGDDSNFIWLKVENKVLYNQPQLHNLIKDILTILPIEFNNITKLDLAKDFIKNTVYTIKRLMKDSEIKTIINGKVVKDRREVVQEMITIYQTSLERIKNPSLKICQAEAVRNKVKGITVQAYNKKAELDNSNKEYISEFYGSPKNLHRLEVRLNSNEIKDYYKKCKKEETIQDIFNEELLTDMYYYHLGSVLRFTKGRKQILWKDILDITNTR